MARVALAIAVALLAACNPPGTGTSEERKPTGTPTDPVLVCERVADVCRLDESRLGVCIQAPAGSSVEACAGRSPCFVCAPQH